MRTPSAEGLLSAAAVLEDQVLEMKHRANTYGYEEEDRQYLLDEAAKCSEVARWLDEVRLLLVDGKEWLP